MSKKVYKAAETKLDNQMNQGNTESASESLEKYFNCSMTPEFEQTLCIIC